MLTTSWLYNALFYSKNIMLLQYVLTCRCTLTCWYLVDMPWCETGLILGLHPANERQSNTVSSAGCKPRISPVWELMPATSGWFWSRSYTLWYVDRHDTRWLVVYFKAYKLLHMQCVEAFVMSIIHPYSYESVWTKSPMLCCNSSSINRVRTGGEW